MALVLQPDKPMENAPRQKLLSTLAKSSLDDIERLWDSSLDQHQFEFLRRPEAGMVMAVGRAGGSGEPFNLGEVSVTRCALRLPSGETGIGYVSGRDFRHAKTIALIDALAQQPEQQAAYTRALVEPLQRILAQKSATGQQQANRTRVEFFTLVRGESE